MVQAEGVSFQQTESSGTVYGQCGPYYCPAQEQQHQATAAEELAFTKATLAVLRTEMDRLARQLPEYETVRSMCGVGEKTAPQLMAEIGDMRRFPRRCSIVSYAGVDPAVDESGKHVSKSNPTTKRGSPHLRRTL